MLAAFNRAVSRFFAPPRPLRLREAQAFRLVPAVGASLTATAAGLVFYYLTLGLLPPASASAATEFPLSVWAQRFDFAQFFGTLLRPPTPSPLTWKIGFAAWGGTLTFLGIAFAGLLSWAVAPSSAIKGLAYGGALGTGFLVLATLANGFHPAVMRNALPDTGLFLLGWSGLATLQLLLTFLLFGFVLGALYRRATPQAALTGRSR